ncbi:endoplasmic reticulum chaperone BiP-like [Haliotis rubra]|uniref:endoplasmic reticulum chaperone BiP-like n=1 Tax=Haliotis rubra TaxID=36100 RepID=UPI001EE633DC|nr:endoplasmic reticulum chaperone BiP-like [Haliotis rubra]
MNYYSDANAIVVCFNQDLFKSTLKPVRSALEDGSLKVSDIQDIVLVGGSTRIPKIQQLVKEFFSGREPTRGINPDEAIAYGAAVQGGVLGTDENSKTPDLLILDVNSLSLGIETVGGVMSKIISRNTAIPSKKTQQFTTIEDDQDVLEVLVYEGERAMTKDNHILGKFELKGIPPAARGDPQIDVTFEIDVNGILTVTAEDIGTGNKNNIVIQNDENRLSPEDMEKMIHDAEEFAEEDKRVKERTDARNDLDHYVYSLRNQINDKSKLGGKLGTGDKSTIEKAVAASIKWMDSHEDASAEDYQKQKTELEDVVRPITSKLYEAAGEEPEEEKEDKSSHPHEDL